MTVEAIVRAFRALPLDQQAEVKARLNEEPEAPELSPELRAELERRLAVAKANPGVGYTMEEVVAYVKRKK